MRIEVTAASGAAGPTQRSEEGCSRGGLPHVTYGSEGRRIHAIGDWFKMDVCELSPRLAHRLNPFARLTGIPVLRPDAVNATGGRALFCVSAAFRAFGRGWGLP